MMQYTVHLYREMRLSYAGIEAETPQVAAAIASGKPTEQADNIMDCEGENLSDLVDTAGDEEYRLSVMIDFEQEQARKAAGALLDACRLVIARWENGDLAEAARACGNAIALATTTGLAAMPQADIYAMLAEKRQIAVIWDIIDVQSNRRDLTSEQAWEVLQAADRQHDATIGITWDVLACVADSLFGDASKADAAAEE